MAISAEEAEVKASCDAAESFVAWYYEAINEKNTLAPFYVDTNARYAAVGVKANITINGKQCTRGPLEYEEMLALQAAGGYDVDGEGGGDGAAATTSTTDTPGTAAAASKNKVRYEVDSINTHVINTNFRTACPPQLLQQPHASQMVEVSGYVDFGPWTAAGGGASASADGSGSTTAATTAGKDDARRSAAFSESFVLVPNWDAVGPKAPRGLRPMLIMTQNFRAL